MSIETITLYDLMAEEFDVYIKPNRKSGFDLDKFDALSAAHHVLHERKRSDEIAEATDRLQWETNKRRWE